MSNRLHQHAAENDGVDYRTHRMLLHPTSLLLGGLVTDKTLLPAVRIRTHAALLIAGVLKKNFNYHF